MIGLFGLVMLPFIINNKQDGDHVCATIGGCVGFEMTIALGILYLKDNL